MDIQELKMVVATNLKRRRLDLGLTQRQVAEQVGVTQGQITHMETGKSSPSLETLAKISEVLHMEPAALLIPATTAKPNLERIAS